MKTFAELKLSAPLNESLKLMGFNTPTPIQAQAIPVVMEGHDLIGLAQTGTGKTAAFGIPMIQHLLANRDASALILVPTRELANQVCDVLGELTQKSPEIRVISIIGGMNMQGQLKQIQKGFRILVATPGRLLDHLSSRSGLLNRVSMFVMDEADRMLDMGFAPQLRQIYPHLPAKRQTLLFSATLPGEIAKLAQKMLRDPVTVQVGEVSVPIAKINQRALRINGDLKNDRLLDEINARTGSMLIFIRTQRRTDRVAKFLTAHGLSVARIHGSRSQGQRNQAINGFRDGEFRILCATDIAARGIDISHVAHVINYDLPQVPEDYVHRIGRTARNGAEGDSLSFISSDEIEQWEAIEKLLKKKGGSPRVETATGTTKRAALPQAERSAATGLSQPQRQGHRKGPRPNQPQMPRVERAPQAGASPTESASEQPRGPRREPHGRRDPHSNRREYAGQRRPEERTSPPVTTQLSMGPKVQATAAAAHSGERPAQGARRQERNGYPISGRKPVPKNIRFKQY